MKFDKDLEDLKDFAYQLRGSLGPNKELDNRRGKKILDLVYEVEFLKNEIESLKEQLP